MDTLEFFNKYTTLIVAFSGYSQMLGGIQPFEFMNFLKSNFTNCDLLFVKDSYSSAYHKGIKGISTDIPSTKEYLKNKIKGHTSVLFLGISGGGYASLLFGSLLSIHTVIAFIPPTVLYKDDKDPEYSDIKKHINNVTLYFLYGDLNVKDFYDPHHISHCDRIGEFPNVHITRFHGLQLKELRNNGTLFQIIKLKI